MRAMRQTNAAMHLHFAADLLPRMRKSYRACSRIELPGLILCGTLRRVDDVFCNRRDSGGAVQSSLPSSAKRHVRLPRARRPPRPTRRKSMCASASPFWRRAQQPDGGTKLVSAKPPGRRNRHRPPIRSGVWSVAGLVVRLEPGRPAEQAPGARQALFEQPCLPRHLSPQIGHFKILRASSRRRGCGRRRSGSP